MAHKINSMHNNIVVKTDLFMLVVLVTRLKFCLSKITRVFPAVQFNLYKKLLNFVYTFDYSNSQ